MNRNGRFWKVEFAFCGSPVLSRRPRGESVKVGRKRLSTLHYSYEISNTAESTESAVASILRQWIQIAQLFDMVCDLEEHLRSEASQVSNFVAIRDYNFSDVSLEYGPSRKQVMNVRWSTAHSKFRLTFGGLEELSGMCPHAMVKEQLEHHLNQNRNLALVAKILHETYGPIK